MDKDVSSKNRFSTKAHSFIQGNAKLQARPHVTITDDNDNKSIEKKREDHDYDKEKEWDIDKNWYDQEEEIVNTKENLGFEIDQRDLDKMETELTEKNKRNALRLLKDQERFLEQNQWEIQKMMKSGVFKLNVNLDRNEDEPKTVVLKVLNVKPPFLSIDKFVARLGQDLYKQAPDSGELHLMAKKGSQLLKNIRERNERVKMSGENSWKIEGSRLGNLLKHKEPVKTEVETTNETNVLMLEQAVNTKDQSKGKSDFMKGKSIKQQREYLPIYTVRQELLHLIADNKIVVIIGETGSGKTTQLTQYLYEEGYANNGVIACTQPRRVAAVSVAKRVSEETETELGHKVGYAIRFEVCTSKSTKIKYMTDGVLLRESLNDENLEQYSVIIMDEAHERSLHTDVLFGILKEVCRRRRDLKVIITSATMNAEKFSAFFGNAPTYQIPGRAFPVEICYEEQSVEDYVDAAIKKALEIHIKEPPGDILIFMTGQEDVEATCMLLQQKLDRMTNVQSLMILPIYSQLPSEAQARIFSHSEERKCIVATNIAETSITLEGVKYVVDTGLCKLKVYNPRVGMDGLQINPISQANADQRSGRAGRTGPGKCFRLYRAGSYRSEMLNNTIPEIQRTNLANVVLLLKSLGLDDLLSFDFMDPPPKETILNAMYQLWILGALDNNGKLTNLGKQMAEFPLDPPLSKILLTSGMFSCSREALTIVSMLSVPSIFYRPRGEENESDNARQRLMVPESDHLTLYNVYRLWKTSGYTEQWCKSNYIHFKSLKKVRDVRKQLKDIMKELKLPINEQPADMNMLRKAICSGYFVNAARIKSIGEYFNLRTGLPCKLHPSSSLFSLGYIPDYVVYHEVILTSKEYLHCVTTVDPHWLAELGPMFFQLKETDQNRDAINTMTKEQQDYSIYHMATIEKRNGPSIQETLAEVNEAIQLKKRNVATLGAKPKSKLTKFG